MSQATLIKKFLQIFEDSDNLLLDFLSGLYFSALELSAIASRQPEYALTKTSLSSQSSFCPRAEIEEKLVSEQCPDETGFKSLRACGVVSLAGLLFTPTKFSEL